MSGRFDAGRLTLARRLAGLTKRELAESVGISPPAITQFEAGQTEPRAAILARLGLVLGYPTAYFTREADRRVPQTESRSFYRSLRATRQWERDQAQALTEHVADLVALLERSFQMPAPDLPDGAWVEPHGSPETVEAAAAEAREAWGLAPGPVGHVVRELEAHGVIVSRLGDQSRRVDAFSRWLDHRPLVVLWAAKADKARSRYDAAHELGHLIMHHDPEPANPLLEQQANRFAAAFLLPASDIEQELPRRAPRAGDWDDLFALRGHWGVSIAALLRRARDLRTLNESAYRRAMIGLSERGLRRGEGDELGPPEEPVFLARAVAALEADPSMGSVADQLHFSQGHLEQLTGSPAGVAASSTPRQLRAV